MTRLRSSRGIWAFVVLTLLASIGPALAEPPPSRRDDGDGVAFFESKVRPLLVEHCIDCHGGKKVRSGLSLIHRENALLGGSRGPAIDIERPEKSLLLAAIAYGRDIEMPPRGKLDAPTRAVFKEWIERGAPWTEGEAGRLGDLESEPPKKRELTDKDRQYWAYRPVVRPARPEVRTPGWNEHPVDAFIAARVEGIGLTPAPTADEVTLLRRASYDLTGLPPTTVEVNAYLEDTSPDKWERLIERLLASPRYGEKWGRHWLDLVRYAETNGYERDSTKLNMWRYRDYVIRSFNEDNPYDRFIIEQIAGDELPNGGADGLLATGFHRLPIWDDEPVDRVQSRADVIADILDTSSMAFLGSTLGCARCHDHKKDPFSQRDYYRMMAFFNNIADHGVGKSITKPVQDDERPNEPVWTIAERDAKLAELETNLAPFLSELKREWAAKGRHLEIEQRVVVPTSETERQTWRYTYETPPEGWEAQAFDDSTWSTGSGGFGRKGTPRSVIGTEWTSKDIFIRRTFRVTEIPRNLAIRFHHDEALDVYLNGVPIFSRQGWRADYTNVGLPVAAKNALVVGSNSLAVRCRNTDGGQYVDVGLLTGVPKHELKRIWENRLRNQGRKLIGGEQHDRAMSILTEIAHAKAQPARRPYPAPIIFERGTNAPKQHLHVRGNANVSGEELEPGFPEVLVPTGLDTPTIPKPRDGVNSTGRRLVLARWIASPDNPLTARVMANRIWQHHFGRGIVRSSSDFGALGTGPTHPELLDYLASEFVARGWSVKSLHRLIMTSRAYRMTSRATAEGLARDPGNDTFWHFDMRRLTAEEIRDSVLAVNATLNREMYGPSIYTKLPREVLETSSRPNQAWGKSPPDQQDRRSIYIFVKRSLREAFLETFDQADTDSSCAVRFITNVPTQTLTMLNSEFMNEESGVLADDLMKVTNDLEQQVSIALSRALSRPPSKDQIARNVEFVLNMREGFDLDPRESLRVFALSLYNLNEFLFLD